MIRYIIRACSHSLESVFVTLYMSGSNAFKTLIVTLYTCVANALESLFITVYVYVRNALSHGLVLMRVMCYQPVGVREG